MLMHRRKTKERFYTFGKLYLQICWKK